MDNKTVVNILNANITKTMGCTDIGVVGYIASIGAFILGDKKIKCVELLMSEELYKNSGVRTTSRGEKSESREKRGFEAKTFFGLRRQ